MRRRLSLGVATSSPRTHATPDTRARIAAIKSDIIQLGRKRDTLLSGTSFAAMDAGTATTVESLMAKEQQHAPETTYIALMEMLLRNIRDVCHDVLNLMRSRGQGSKCQATEQLSVSYIPSVAALLDFALQRNEACDIFQVQMKDLNNHIESLEKKVRLSEAFPMLMSHAGTQTTTSSLVPTPPSPPNIVSATDFCFECGEHRKSIAELKSQVSRLQQRLHTSHADTVSSLDVEKERH
eukprot:PhF_6_TR12866/c0_g1_i1/m.20217